MPSHTSWFNNSQVIIILNIHLFDIYIVLITVALQVCSEQYVIWNRTIRTFEQKFGFKVSIVFALHHADPFSSKHFKWINTFFLSSRYLHINNNNFFSVLNSYSGNYDLHKGSRKKDQLYVIIGSAAGAAILLLATIISCLFMHKGKTKYYDQGKVLNQNYI